MGPEIGHHCECRFSSKCHFLAVINHTLLAYHLTHYLKKMAMSSICIISLIKLDGNIQNASRVLSRHCYTSKIQHVYYFIKWLQTFLAIYRKLYHIKFTYLTKTTYCILVCQSIDLYFFKYVFNSSNQWISISRDKRICNLWSPWMTLLHHAVIWVYYFGVYNYISFMMWFKHARGTSVMLHIHVTFLGGGGVVVVCVIFRICLTWWRHQMETFSALLAICAGRTKASDAELWCFLRFSPE